MKRKGLVIITFLLVIFICNIGTAEQVSAYSMPAYVDIGVKYKSSAKQSYVVTSDSELSIADATANGFANIKQISNSKTVTVINDGGKIVLKNAKGEIIGVDWKINSCLVPLNYETNRIALDGVKFRGGLKFWADNSGGGKIRVINFLPTEHYLYGVIHKEMSRSNPLEALKAQAVAARSYLASNLGRHKADGFDLCDTTHCQVYGAVEAEYDTTKAACDMTRNQVITYGDKVVPAYYHSNSGGHTLSIEDVWGSTFPYLIGKPDPYTPLYEWKAEVTFEELLKKLNDAKFNTGKIKSVKITKRNSAGAVDTITVTGENGTAEIKKDKIRSMLGATNVKSTMFNFGDKLMLADITPAKKVYLLGSAGIVVEAKETLFIEDLIQKNEVFLNGLAYTNGSQIVKADLNETISTNPNDVVVTTSPLKIAGKGYGHGVGMSQRGAIEMAKQGKTYVDILKFYYQGVEVN